MQGSLDVEARSTFRSPTLFIPQPTQPFSTHWRSLHFLKPLPDLVSDDRSRSLLGMIGV
jgi:hypothetical protein